VITAALFALSLQSSDVIATDVIATCNVAFTINRTFADDIAISCTDTDDVAGAEAEALRQVSWERDYSEYLIERNGDRIETTLTLYGDRTGNGIDWWGPSQLLVRLRPQYPVHADFAAARASCIVVYNVRNGFTRVVDSSCNAREQADSFGRSARNTVRRLIYSRGRDVDCLQLAINYRIDDGDLPDWPATPACE
jgi:hypothetical protein